MTRDADIHLATYGTLGPGKPNHHHLSALRGTWTTGFVRGRLHEEGWGAAQGYPGLVLGDGDEIRVDLLRSEDLPEHWPRLDAFEGDGYRRVATTVVTATGDVDACIYVLAGR
ncbi:gamma-glutamylcyclotransferase [uncultured Methylobacterium sp.]|jgi:gamma-glutamylcyclotransferase (GGCT)/AIG2-like uncharacterized protein YtfP|uniref:gamma-glutamylcyclotransferase family protein n=1 Tax=uncultured Methylobacterium sp. TaxID=157278 RepID=UPI0026374204|nr:gamma-glutamylcyclotransferase [uncultured Methylobacterium sp.]